MPLYRLSRGRVRSQRGPGRVSPDSDPRVPTTIPETLLSKRPSTSLETWVSTPHLPPLPVSGGRKGGAPGPPDRHTSRTEEGEEKRGRQTDSCVRGPCGVLSSPCLSPHEDRGCSVSTSNPNRVKGRLTPGGDPPLVRETRRPGSISHQRHTETGVHPSPGRLGDRGSPLTRETQRPGSTTHRGDSETGVHPSPERHRDRGPPVTRETRDTNRTPRGTVSSRGDW